MQLASILAQLYRAYRDLGYQAAGAAHGNEFTHPKCIVEQEEHAGYDVFHQGLCAKADRQPEHACASQ